MKRLVFVPILLSLVLVGGRTASASSIMPSFDGAPAGWTTDRYQPNVFADIGLFSGRDNVLEIGIDRAQGATARPAAFSSQFYDTQGMQYAMSGNVGDILAADLFVEQSWGNAGNGHVRTDMWNGMTNGAAISVYAIIGFTNYGGAARFRAWDPDAGGDGWVNLASPVNYGTWNSFEIRLSGLSIDYYVNGALAYSDLTLGGTTNFGSTIMQAYNFFDPVIPGANAVNYAAHWSNTAAVPEPATLSLLGIGLAGLAVGFRRRRPA